MSSLSNSPAKATAGTHSDEEFKLREIKTLSKNALRDICDSSKADQVKGQIYFVQALDVKVFTEADNKKNIK
jgi:hypothetical protein